MFSVIFVSVCLLDVLTIIPYESIHIGADFMFFGAVV